MLRRIQRLREHIRYHSAPRRSSAWSRAMDIAFIAAFTLALPMTLLADLTVREQRTALEATGILALTADGRADAWLMSGQTGTGARARPAPQRNDQIVGNFTLRVMDEVRGWPLTTSVVRAPAVLTIDDLSQPMPRVNVALDLNDPYQRAIDDALQNDKQQEIRSAWVLAEPIKRWQWWAWFPAFGAWWMLMFAGAALCIQTTRFAALWVRAKRLQREYVRRAENRCVRCGYDMTGLEFNERCPECGTQVW